MGDLFWLSLPWLFLLYLALFIGLCCAMSLVEQDSKSGATAAHAVSTPPRPPKPRLRQSVRSYDLKMKARRRVHRVIWRNNRPCLWYNTDDWDNWTNPRMSSPEGATNDTTKIL